MGTEVLIVIIAAIIGPILVLFISELFRYLNFNKEKEERFFYEVYKKRQELYEEIINATEMIPENEEAILLDTQEKHKNYFMEKYRILTELAARCIIFGSLGVMNAVNCLLEMLKMYINMLGEPDTVMSETGIANRRKIIKAKLAIASAIRVEMGAEIVDKKINDFMRNIKIDEYFDKQIVKDKYRMQNKVPK